MVTQKLRESLGASLVVLTLLRAHFPAESAPLKIETTDIAQASSGELEGIAATNSPFVWFSIRQNPDSRGMSGAWFEKTNEFGIISRISERLYNLDIEILESELQKNDMRIRWHNTQLHTGIDVFLNDLQPVSPKTNEMDAIMQHVVKTIAEQKASSSQNEVQGWQSAIVCLLMVAMVFVVAIARR